jgi:hypothetical protein
MQGFISKGGLGLLLAALLGLLLVAAGCGGGGGAVRETDGAGKKKSPSSPTVSVNYNNGYQISVQGKDMRSVEIDFTTSATQTYMLNKQGKCSVASRDGIDSIKVTNKGGDYWYFDGAGKPRQNDDDDDRDGRDGDRDGRDGDRDDDDDDDDRDGNRRGSGLLGNVLGGTLGLVGKVVRPVPVIRVSCTGGPYDRQASSSKQASALGSVIVNVASNVAFSQVKVATATDAVLTYDTGSATSGSYDTEASVLVEAVQVTLAADGSKWYFDSEGNILPQDSKWYQDLD